MHFAGPPLCHRVGLSSLMLTARAPSCCNPIGWLTWSTASPSRPTGSGMLEARPATRALMLARTGHRRPRGLDSPRLESAAMRPLREDVRKSFAKQLAPRRGECADQRTGELAWPGWAGPHLVECGLVRVCHRTVVGTDRALAEGWPLADERGRVVWCFLASSGDWARRGPLACYYNHFAPRWGLARDGALAWRADLFVGTGRA